MDRIFIFLILGLSWTAAAQSPDYFQQEVHYDIQVTLDDQEHSLEGVVALEYTNHSPQTLPFIYFHLWAKAFERPESAFSRQQLRNGNTDFYFAKDKDLGGYPMVDFLVDGAALKADPDPVHPDVVKVWLPKALEPGSTMQMTIPFKLKIPASFSRLGHIEESYQMTQWYPKPAVFDQEGWHPMPYLDLGEFYSEFGSFKVQITLPENYVVGATGVLQNAEEREWLEERIVQTNEYLANRASSPAEDTFPASSARMKTLTYTADRVHDFAWFADKRFLVQRGAVQLPDSSMVETWAMFTHDEEDLWVEAIAYLERALLFYSEQVGAYPYPQMTAVHSALSAGGGMEYPMITVIDKSYNAEYLDETILHEVGHNWFYGILGFNERTDAWLDEGINTYYEMRYSERYYNSVAMDILEPYYLGLVRRRMDQAADTHSDSLSEANYWLAAYDKPAMAWRYLEGWLGQEKFDAGMKAFYEEWKFKHPNPEAVQQFWEDYADQKLDWLFQGVIGTTDRLDYAIKSIREQGDQYVLEIENRGGVAGPFPLTGIQDGVVQKQQWYAGFEGAITVSFPKGDFKRIRLDADRYLPEFQRKNNEIRPEGLFKKIEPINPVVGLKQGSPNKTNVYFFPAVLWNNYDKGMIGFALFNHWQIEKPFEFELVPALSLANSKLGGTGAFRFNLYPSSNIIHRIQVGAFARQFHYDYNWQDAYYLQYRRFSPRLQIDLARGPLQSFRQQIRYMPIFLQEEQAAFDEEGAYVGNSWESRTIHRLQYRGYHSRALHPFGILVGLEQQSYTSVFQQQERYLRLDLKFKGSYTYQSNRNIDYRIFAGIMLDNTRRDAGAIFPGAINLTGQGYQGHDDYAYNELYLGRNDNRGVWAQQISLRDGAFKNAFGAPFQAQSGNSNSFLVALNLKGDLPQDLPGKLPVKPYFDVAYSRDARPTASDKTFADQLWWSGGFALDFGDGIFAIYFPVVHSKNLRDLYQQDGKSGYFSTITFNLNLQRLNLIFPAEDRF